MTSNKKINFINLFSSILSITAISFLISSCGSTSYFRTSNDVYKTPAIINLMDGKKVEGKITILFESGLNPVNYIVLNNVEKEEKILIDDIKSYEIKNTLYFPKQIIIENTGEKRILFLKELSKIDSRIQLLELYQQKNINTNEIERHFYFIVTDKQERFEVLSLTKKELVPNFDYKMSKIVEDCPTLANKILTKTKGYFVPSITFSDYKTLETLQNIIEDYNNCK